MSVWLRLIIIKDYTYFVQQETGFEHETQTVLDKQCSHFQSPLANITTNYMMIIVQLLYTTVKDTNEDNRVLQDYMSYLP